MQINANEMYPENSSVVEQLLNDMATLPMRKVGELFENTYSKVSQWKFIRSNEKKNEIDEIIRLHLFLFCRGNGGRNTVQIDCYL